MPLSGCIYIRLRESPQQRSGMEYEVANGASLANEGERSCLMMTRGATAPKRTTFQVSEVHNTLLSITRAADSIYECHLNAKGGYLLDTYGADKIPIARKGTLYVMKAWVRKDPENGPRQTQQGLERQG